MIEISVVKEFLPLIAAGGAVISATGLVPRVGPGRAAWIALRSRFGCKPNHESLRVDELKLLRSMIAEPLGQGYLVVAGEKGVGKTCFLRTVINKTPGVITIKALPSQNAHTIIENALRKLTGMPFDLFPPIGSVARVIFWHKIFTRGQSPVVIIDAAERKVGEEYAGLTAAVRTLVDDYKLRVIVDGSPNSLDESLLRTKRQRVFEIKPMTKEMVWQIGQLQPLFEYVKRTNLEDTVFAVLGGVPADYEELWENCAIHLKTGRDAREVIGFHLCTTIHAAIRLVKRACGSDDLTTAKLRKLYQETRIFTDSTLVANNLKRPTLDKVFREVDQNGEFVLIPATNAIGIVLRHNLTKRPTLDKLEQLIKKEE